MIVSDGSHGLQSEGRNGCCELANAAASCRRLHVEANSLSTLFFLLALPSPPTSAITS